MSLPAALRSAPAAPVAPGRPLPPGRPFAGRLRRATMARPLGAAAALGLLAILLVALLGPALPLPAPDAQALGDRLRAPLSRGRDGTLHILGTDQLGRDVLSRTIGGASVSLGIAGATVLVSGVVGSLVGLLAGYRRGATDFVAMRLIDVQMAVPPLLLAIFLLYLLGSSLVNLVLLLSILSWWSYARIVRAETLKLRSAPFVEAAVVAGCSERRVILRHLLPQLVPVLVVVAVLDVGSVMLAEAGISFLGFGVQPPDSSWGLLVADGQAFVTTGAWWLFGAPGLAIFATVLLARLASSWFQTLLAAAPPARPPRRRRSGVLGKAGSDA